MPTLALTREVSGGVTWSDSSPPFVTPQTVASKGAATDTRAQLRGSQPNGSEGAEEEEDAAALRLRLAVATERAAAAEAKLEDRAHRAEARASAAETRLRELEAAAVGPVQNAEADAHEKALHVALQKIEAADVRAQAAQRLAAEEAHRAAGSEVSLALWEQLLSRMLTVLLLGPEMTEQYKRTLTKELGKALRSLDMVDEVGNLQCSFPAVPGEAPRLRLLRWEGRLSQPVEWAVAWASASWAVSLSVEGRLYGVGFSLGLRLHGFGIRGRVSIAFPGGDRGDLSEVELCFTELPEVTFALESNVKMGLVPLPIRSQLDAKVRSTLSQVLSTSLVAPNKTSVKISALRPKQALTDNDIRQACEDAELARRAARAVSG